MKNVLKYLFAAMMCLLSQKAAALTLSPIEQNSYASVGYCTVDCSAPYKTIFGIDSAISSTGSRASNRTILSKSPSLSSYAEADMYNGALNAKNYFASAGGYARLVYDFEITGPETIQIPVLVEASANLKATGGTYFSYVSGIGAQSDAYLYLLHDNGYGNPNTILINKHETVSYGIGDTGGVKTSGFDVNDIFFLTTNTEYQVQMTVNSVASLSVFTGVTAVNDLTTEATIDPTFTIDPAYSKEYSLTFSEGLVGGSVSPVPLPASAPMMGAALLALGAVGYGMKRKRKAGL